MPVKEGYTYFKEVAVNHTDDAAQNLYQMKLLVGESSGAAGEQVDCEGHCLSTFNDLWFQGLDADGTTIVDLDYWIESITGTTPNQLATIWVEVHYIPAHPDNTTVWMSYGKAGASAASSGTSTFVDFSNGDDYATAWTASGGTWSQQVGYIRGILGSSAAGTLTRTSKTISDGRLRAKIVQSSDAADHAPGTNIFFRGDGASTGYQLGQTDLSSGNKIEANSIGDWTNWGGNTPIAKAIALGTAYILDVHTKGNTSGGSHDDTVVTDGTTSAHTSGGFGIRLYEVTSYVYWFFQANYTTNEPTWGTWSSEQTLPAVHMFYYPHILAH